MTEREYRQAEGVSRSELFTLTESPEKFKWAKEHPEEPTPALLFGQVVHKLLLEPHGFDHEFAVMPVVDRRTKAGKEAFAEWAAGLMPGQQAVDAETYQKAAEMVEKALDNEYVVKLLAGDRECPFFWTDDLTGEPCKARLDCLTEIGDKLVIVDYKSAADARTDAFMHAAVKHGYDLQAAMYSEAVKQNTGVEPVFVFIAQEKTPPYAINIMQADDIFVRRGKDLFRELIGVYHECKKTDNWYGYLGPYNVINNLALPAWLAKEVE